MQVSRVVLWEINQQLFLGHQARCMPLYDHVFVLDSGLLPVLQAGGIRHLSHLRACADPEEHQPIEATPTDTAYEAEVCFVGAPYPDRVAMLRALTNHHLRIYGLGWAGQDESLERCVSTEPVYGRKKAKIYSRSRISLNVHGPHMIRGENFRVFEVAACGGVSFSTASADLESCLTPDREVVLFEGPDDLSERIDDLLSRPAELAAVAGAGRRRVLAEHTYDHRAVSILDALECGR